MPVPGHPEARRAPLRVLVVDDDPDNAWTMAPLLGLCGHEARAFRPDAVVLDLAMPGLDGFAVAEALRADPATAGARLVALTGRNQPGARARAAELGFEAFLVKPVGPERLLELLGCPDRG